MKKLALILLLLGALGAASQLWKQSPMLTEAVAASPLLTALTGTAHSTGNQIASADALLGQLPGLQGWRTFAKPLPLGSDGLLLFQRVGSGAVVWRVDWKRNKVSSFQLRELQLQKDGRYTALSSEDGVWLLGEKSILIRPDGERLILNTGFNEPVAVLLDDQSVLVLGPALHGTSQQSDQYRMQQLSLSPDSTRLQAVDRGLLSYDGSPNQPGQTYRMPRYGHSAVKLRDGRVLLLGGDLTPTLASLIEPRAGEGRWSVTPVAPMPNERKLAAAMLLPDGRVIVTGAPYLHCYGEAKNTRSVDVFDVQNNSWSSLPALPFVPCSDAYGADTPAIAVTPGGSLVVGAYLEPQLMVLPRDGASATGYGANWRVHGRMPLRRISGVVQVLSDQEVLVAGGVDTQSGGCCYATSGFDLVSIAQNETSDSLAMSFIGAGVARRGNSLFAGGGRRFGSTGFGQMRYSAYAELVDLVTGKARQLPNIPFATGAAQAVWLDDERVLFKGAREASSNGFTPDVPSYTPPSSADMAIFHVRENRWSEPISIRELERAQIVAAAGDKVLLLGAGGQPFRLDLSTRKLELLHAEHGLTDGIARLLLQGLVIAGGYVPSDDPQLAADCAGEPESDFDVGDIAESPEGERKSDAVAELAPECRQPPDEEEPEADGAAPIVPTAMVEVLSLDQAVPALPAGPAARGPANMNSTVITAEGQVVVLARNPETREVSMARIGLGGKEWESMSFPPELVGGQADACGRCALSVAPDPRNSGKDLVFFRQGAIDADWVDDDIGEQSMNVWWWDEATKGWHRVLQGRGKSTRSTPLALGEPLSPRQGKRMMSMGWHLREPVLWMEP